MLLNTKKERSLWDSETEATLARAISVWCWGHSTDVSLYVKEVEKIRLQVKELSLLMRDDSKESFRLMEMKQDSKKPMAKDSRDDFTMRSLTKPWRNAIHHRAEITSFQVIEGKVKSTDGYFVVGIKGNSCQLLFSH